ncbi:hypothetical protein R3P38DRAFT_3202940 [Favolaschia claudopus]|uniref:Uncharacterized protein n=1 Tax=Favolaschia claudopus TaxID=2862362 RepID=A0AAW0ATK3_9AGAR
MPTVPRCDVATLSSSTTSDAGDDHQALPQAQLLVVSSLKCFTNLLKHSRPLTWWMKTFRAARDGLTLPAVFLWKISITGGPPFPSILLRISRLLELRAYKPKTPSAA